MNTDNLTPAQQRELKEINEIRCYGELDDIIGRKLLNRVLILAGVLETFYSFI